MFSQPCIVAFIVLGLLFSLVHARDGKRTQVWFCLERCDNYKTPQIMKNLEIARKYSKTSLTSVSYEIYNIGPNATIYEVDDLTKVHHIVSDFDSYHGGKVDTFPMISSYPYPKEIIQWMRFIFKNPDPFVQSCLDHLEKLTPKATGLNVDFEPVDGITSDDALDYARFLNYYSKRMTEHGYEIQVDVASWSPLWNFTLLSEQEYLSEVTTMSTYAGPKESWEKAFQKAVNEIGTKKLNVGLMSINPTTQSYLNDEEIKWRFAEMKSNGVQSVSLWRMTNELEKLTQWWDSFHDFLES